MHVSDRHGNLKPQALGLNVCRLKEPMQQLQHTLLHRGPMEAGDVRASEHGVAMAKIPFIALDKHFVVRVTRHPSQLSACLGDVEVDGSTVH